MTRLLGLALPVLVVAWLTAAGMSVRSASRIWLRHWAERRLRGSMSAALYLERPQRLLLAGSTAAAAAAALGGALVGTWLGRGPAASLRAAALYAAAMLVAGQLVPRAIGRRWASSLVPLFLPPLRLADVLLWPVLRGGGTIARSARGAEPPGSAAVGDGRQGRPELQELLREGELEGVGDHEESAIIAGVVQFGDTPVERVMTARECVFALDDALSPAELSRHIAHSGFSRVPIYRRSLDDITGMVHAFDVLHARGERPPRLRPVAAARAATPCNELLFTMLRARQHLAVVRDAGARTIGIVTLEDLLEQLVGDIRDEHDEPGDERRTGAAEPTAAAEYSAPGRDEVAGSPVRVGTTPRDG